MLAQPPTVSRCLSCHSAQFVPVPRTDVILLLLVYMDQLAILAYQDPNWNKLAGLHPMCYEENQIAL